MAELEKVVNGLQHCFNAKCEGCPYGDTESGHYACKKHEMLGDALELLKARQWISAEEKMPELEGDYLVTDGHHTPRKCRLLKLGPLMGWVDGIGNDHIKYWMPLPPLPEPPKEGDVDENA